jgi:electron transfer flavoprotein alpha subunit
MSVLIFADNQDGKIIKSSLEAAAYGSKIAKEMGTEAIALTFGNIEGDGGLGSRGVSKVLVDSSIDALDSARLSKLVTKAAEDNGADIIIFSHDHTGKLVAPRVAAKLDCGIVTGAVEMPDMSDGFMVKKNVFSGKAIANISITSDKKVITLLPNSIQAEVTDATAEVESYSADTGEPTVKVKEVEKMDSEDGIPLPEAELVVSAGRGLKGPENWGMIEELADSIGAATACSRPVADMDWRPHHEHVGQTGVTIRPNLYIAIGISGAIQHLAGVNGSKTIVVINTDPEAPFFKAADYGIVGDAFDVVPKLTEAFKKFNADN